MVLRRTFPTGCAGAAATVLYAADARVKLLASTPPLGWMSWNQFGPEVSDTLLREMAGTRVTPGMKAAGYEYICIDDLWQGGRDLKGNLYPHPKRFPMGITAVADYVRERAEARPLLACGRQDVCGATGQPRP
jgi:alpha-galactosidase